MPGDLHKARLPFIHGGQAPQNRPWWRHGLFGGNHMPTSLVLERKGKLSLRDIDLDQDLSPTDVRIAVHTVGVC